MGLPDAVTPDATRVEFAGLGIRRGGRWVIRGLDWAHGPGGVAWLVGENGAGKSSLLRVLAGRLAPNEGRVEGAPRPGTPGALLYYHPAMRLPGGVRVRDWDRLVAALVPEPATGPRLRPPGLPAGRRLDRLSTGEAKRLQLDALLDREATLLLLDEPDSHLSARARRSLVERLAAHGRRATVLVATNQPLPDAAERVLHLDEPGPK